MKRVSLIITVVMLSFLVVGCGEGKGKPLPGRKEGFQLADSSSWQAQLIWDQAPRYSDEEFLEMRGVIVFRDPGGNLPSSIESVSLVADMPQHGHGTGNIQPILSQSSEDSSRFRFKNLYFTMTGSWRIKVAATVNGKLDTWYTTVEVGAR